MCRKVFCFVSFGLLLFLFFSTPDLEVAKGGIDFPLAETITWYHPNAQGEWKHNIPGYHEEEHTDFDEPPAFFGTTG